MHCQLLEADFSQCEANGVVFADCELSGAVFFNTHLEKADFRTAVHYSFDPENNKIKKAKFSLDQVVRLLDKYQIDIEPN